MMGKLYQRKTRCSKRKMPSTPQGTVSVETADGLLSMQSGSGSARAWGNRERRLLRL